MNKQEQIMEMMHLYRDNNRNTYTELSAEEVKAIQAKYNVNLPESFIWFITQYYFEGLSVDIPARAVRTNKNCLDSLNETYKTKDYPEKLFIISHVDEYDYCLDTQRLMNGECPVVSYSIHDNDRLIDRYISFYDFLIDEINNAIDNDFFE